MKNRVLPTAVRLLGEELEEPARISLTKTVPAAVPSLFHNSVPFTSKAVKNSVRVLPTTVRLLGLIFLTRTVPAAVPSLFHSPLAFTPSLVQKNRVLPSAVRL